ncbi:cadherin repeat domain-containing protein [Fibrobacter succinogenes]|uniref:cadherin repeat domain-containing protein n=1 Tax=Fibrobacter succinogenes TaxID=833 RepID=UPI0013D3F40E|nr:cadherin repeat domain-containing protein [Fibrobacter succinogenes]
MVRVNNVKNFLNKLWLVLIVAGVASAADVAPLVFDGLTTYYNADGSIDDALKVQHQNYWNKLMTFKMWGTEGITMGHASTPDVNGAIGTAKNGMLFTDGEHNLGGPIYVGGSINFDTGNDAFLSGPVRVTENFTAGANGNRFYGTYCIEGTASKKQHNLDDDFTNAGEQIGRYAQGGAAKVGMCSYDSVPEVPTYLSIPDVPATTDLGYATVIDVIGSTKSVGSSEYIDVPPIKIVGKDTLKMYDLYINGDLVFNAGSKLYIRMESPRSLLRVFLNGTVNAASSSMIQVVYVGEGAQYIGGSWTNVTNPVYVENKEYAGNVLFHCKDDINWSSMNGDAYFQGSFLTMGTLKVGSNLVLAGQLLGNKLDIGYDFKGDDFRYVPFDPPVLSTAEGVKTYLVEGHKQDTVKISLDKKATTTIDFEYCFDFNGTVDGKDPNGNAARADIATADIPLFNGTECVNPGKAYFDIDSVNLRTPIILTALDDKIDEGTDSKPGKETFRIIIQNLNAATLKDGSHDGYITLEISDPDLPPLTFEKTVLNTIDENPNNGTPIDTLRGIHGTIGCPDCVYSLSDTSHYSDFVTIDPDGTVRVKDSTIFDFEKIQSIDIQVHVEDVENKMKADTTVIIPIGNVNENPILEDQEFEIDEHEAPGTVVGTLVWGENDSVGVFRQDEFTAVGGDTDLFAVSKTGVITTKKEFDYETEPHTYAIDVMLADKNDPTLFVIKTVTITINDVNENPKIVTDTIKVKENSDPGTVVDTLEAIDNDGDPLTWTLVNDPSKCFDVSAGGVVTTKECDRLDYEKNQTITIRVMVEDGRGGSDIENIVVQLINVPPPTIEIPVASNVDTTWHYPEIIYTNKDSINVCWEVNKKNLTCADTILDPGYNKICKEACDVDGFEGCAEDCFIAYFSDVSPKVTIDAGGEANLASNIYTIVEQPAAGDTNVYVKDSVRSINVYITDYDPIMGETRDTLKFEKVDLTKKVAVPQQTYDALSTVAKQTVSLDELNPNTTRTPINGTSVLNSYPTKIAGTEVTVSYVTDTKGNIVKQAVVNEKGKVDSIEVITVSYQTEINGQLVTISYQADATTGKALNVDGNGSFVATKNEDASAGIFKVSYEYLDRVSGETLELTYVVDKRGNLVKNPDGDRGYQVTFTYEDKYGNVAEQSVFVVLDQTLPVVEILSPMDNQVSHANYVNVEWTVNGEKQDTLTTQGLVKGPNVIVRFYKDKAGNVAADTVRVFMKEGKDLDISVERPVTIIDKDKVDEYYADNPPKKGQTFAVSVRNPSTEEEVETLIGGSFKTQEGSGEKPYANTKSSKHLGPTLILDVKLPTVNDGKSGSVSGLATLDDLLLANGKISSAGIGIDTSKLDATAKKDYKEYTVEEYVSEFCEDGTKIPSDLSQFNLYNSSLKLDIWIYTTIGNFVGKYSFTQELNDPSFANGAGVTQIYFELKPDKDGYVHAKNGKLLATGAYLYKVDANLRNQLRCTVPPLGGTSTKTKGDVTKTKEEMLKAFGYKRPANKK